MSSSEEFLSARRRVDLLEHHITNMSHHEYHKLLEEMALQLAANVTDEQWDTALARSLKEVF